MKKQFILFVILLITSCGSLVQAQDKHEYFQKWLTKYVKESAAYFKADSGIVVTEIFSRSENLMQKRWIEWDVNQPLLAVWWKEGGELHIYSAYLDDYYGIWTNREGEEFDKNGNNFFEIYELGEDTSILDKVMTEVVRTIRAAGVPVGCE